VLVFLDGSAIVVVLIGFYFFLKLLGSDISEKLEIFWRIHARVECRCAAANYKPGNMIHALAGA
jgi:hypothetical protein